MLGRNIFDKVDEISHSIFFFCNKVKSSNLSQKPMFFYQKKVKGHCADVFKLLKYWKIMKVNYNLIKFTYCSCKHSTFYSQQKYMQFSVINAVIRNINYLLQIFRPVPGWYHLSFLSHKIQIIIKALDKATNENNLSNILQPKSFSYFLLCINVSSVSVRRASAEKSYFLFCCPIYELTLYISSERNLTVQV